MRPKMVSSLGGHKLDLGYCPKKTNITS